ncbi:MAG: hypothetical protein WC785_10485 [Tatlockia sp.]|jgi:hypothetical protein
MKKLFSLLEKHGREEFQSALKHISEGTWKNYLSQSKDAKDQGTCNENDYRIKLLTLFFCFIRERDKQCVPKTDFAEFWRLTSTELHAHFNNTLPQRLTPDPAMGITLESVDSIFLTEIMAADMGLAHHATDGQTPECNNDPGIQEYLALFLPEPYSQELASKVIWALLAIRNNAIIKDLISQNALQGFIKQPDLTRAEITKRIKLILASRVKKVIDRLNQFTIEGKLPLIWLVTHSGIEDQEGQKETASAINAILSAEKYQRKARLFNSFHLEQDKKPVSPLQFFINYLQANPETKVVKKNKIHAKIQQATAYRSASFEENLAKKRAPEPIDSAPAKKIKHAERDALAGSNSDTLLADNEHATPFFSQTENAFGFFALQSFRKEILKPDYHYTALDMQRLLATLPDDPAFVKVMAFEYEKTQHVTAIVTAELEELKARNGESHLIVPVCMNQIWVAVIFTVVEQKVSRVTCYSPLKANPVLYHLLLTLGAIIPPNGLFFPSEQEDRACLDAVSSGPFLVDSLWYAFTSKRVEIKSSSLLNLDKAIRKDHLTLIEECEEQQRFILS